MLFLIVSFLDEKYVLQEAQGHRYQLKFKKWYPRSVQEAQ